MIKLISTEFLKVHRINGHRRTKIHTTVIAINYELSYKEFTLNEQIRKTTDIIQVGKKSTQLQ